MTGSSGELLSSGSLFRGVDRKYLEWQSGRRNLDGAVAVR